MKFCLWPKALGSMEIYEADYRLSLPEDVEPDSDEDINRDLVASGLRLCPRFRVAFRMRRRARSQKRNWIMTRWLMIRQGFSLWSCHALWIRKRRAILRPEPEIDCR